MRLQMISFLLGAAWCVGCSGLGSAAEDSSVASSSRSVAPHGQSPTPEQAAAIAAEWRRLFPDAPLPEIAPLPRAADSSLKQQKKELGTR